MHMIIKLDGYRHNKIEIIKVPVFSRVYKEYNTVIGELPNGEKVIITGIDKEW